MVDLSDRKASTFQLSQDPTFNRANDAPRNRVQPPIRGCCSTWSSAIAALTGNSPGNW